MMRNLFYQNEIRLRIGLIIFKILKSVFHLQKYVFIYYIELFVLQITERYARGSQTFCIATLSIIF